MERIEPSLWNKCVNHMLKEMEYYLELDGITAPTGNSNMKTETAAIQTIDLPSSSNQIPSTSSELVIKLKSKWFPSTVAKTEPEKFKCIKCSFETTRKHCLDQHIKGHLDCNQCGKTFIGKNGSRNLKSHLKTHQVKIPHMFNL